MIGKDLGPGGRLGFFLLAIKWMTMGVTMRHTMQLRIESSIFDLLQNPEKDKINDEDDKTELESNPCQYKWDLKLD